MKLKSFVLPIFYIFFSSLILSSNGFSQQKVVGILGVSETQWVDFKNVEGAFSIKLPAQPDPIHKEIPNPTYPDYPPYFIYMYSAVDQHNMVNYLIRYSDFPAGMYLADKSTVFEASIKDLQSKGEMVGEPTVIFNNGFEGRSVQLILNEMLMEVQLFLRGNRTYLLLRQNTQGTEPPKADAFFDSFKLEKYAFNKGVSTKIGTITLEMPQKPTPMPKEEDIDESASFFKNSRSYYAVNANSGGLYGIEQADVSKYYRVRNLDSLYTSFLKNLHGKGDSIYSSENVMMGTAKGRQSRSYNKLSGTYKLYRIWIHNNSFYCGTVLGDKEELEGVQWSSLFKNISYAADSKPFDLAASKVHLIMKDLKSTDTLIHKESLGAIRFYEFTKDELPQIYTALRYKYDDDTLRSGTRSLLIQQLTKLNDEKTVPLLKELYNDKQNAEWLRLSALSKTTEVNKNNYDWYLNSLLVDKYSNSDLAWNLFQPLRDSLYFAAKHIDKLCDMMGHKPYRPELLTVISYMLTDSLKDEYVAIVKGVREKVMSNAMSDLDVELEKLDHSEELDYGMIYAYMRIMAHLSMPEMIDEFTEKLLAVDSIPYLHTAALAARIATGLNLDQQVLKSQLDSLESRYDIMDAFYKAGKINEVPSLYRKHNEFAKLLMYNHLYDENDYPDSISLLGELKEGAEIYYVFEFVYNDDEGAESTYIGVVGAFDDQADKLDFEAYSCHTNFDKKAEDWTSQANALIKELKSQ